jgi:hypothetical protein
MSEWSFPASDPPATWTWDPVDEADKESRGLRLRTVGVGYDRSRR